MLIELSLNIYQLLSKCLQFAIKCPDCPLGPKCSIVPINSYLFPFTSKKSFISNFSGKSTSQLNLLLTPLSKNNINILGEVHILLKDAPSFNLLHFSQNN